MHGLGTIVEQNSTSAELLRLLAVARFPRFAKEIQGAPVGLYPAPVLWGDNLLAIAWHHERNGQLEHLQVLDAQGLKKLFRRLPREIRSKVLRSLGEPEEAL